MGDGIPPDLLDKPRLEPEDEGSKHTTWLLTETHGDVQSDTFITEKDASIASLVKSGKEKDANFEATREVVKLNNQDIFVNKPRKAWGNQGLPSEPFNCEYSFCESTCEVNMCGKKVCEECSSVSFSKLRSLMIKCNTIYFTCKVATSFNVMKP